MACDFSDLFFTCSLIEFIGRAQRLSRREVVAGLGAATLAHIYAHAETLHCEPIAKSADYFTQYAHLPTGDFDNVSACRYDVPDYWSIGKVYARLIEDVLQDDDVVQTLIAVYSSPIDTLISNYNSDFFYQPRDFLKFEYLDWAQPVAS